MATKEERAAEAQKHVGLVRGVFESDIARAVEAATIYEDGEGRDLELPEPAFEQTEAVTVWSSLDRAMDHAKGKVCVVDPASYGTPGGNYLSGGWSPEAQICAESALYPVLEGLKEKYFEGNRQSMHGGLYSDRAAYIPDVAFTTGGTMRTRDVLVIAPPNRRFALENHRSDAECAMDLQHRIEALMNIAAAHQPDTLVAGAFGCGAFDNDAAEVAALFKAWIDAHPGQIGRVEFVIPGGPSLDVFREIFPEPVREATVIVEEIAENDDDDDELTDIEPNSDGRWVFD